MYDNGLWDMIIDTRIEHMQSVQNQSVRSMKTIQDPELELLFKELRALYWEKHHKVLNHNMIEFNDDIVA